MARAKPRWLAIHHHRVRGFLAPFLIVLQHDLIDSRTRVVAPVIKSPRSQDATILAPRIEIGGIIHQAMLLDMAAVPLSLLADVEPVVALPEDTIAAGLDAIFSGYPVGLSG